MKATADAPRAGPEHLARQHHAGAARLRAAPDVHRRLLGHRADVEPVDLRQGDRERRLRRRDPREGGEGTRARTLFFELAIEDLRRAADLFSRSTSGPTASTAGSRSRSRRCSPTTPRARSQAAKDAARAGRSRQPLHQDPGHGRGPARDRGGHLRRRARERDAAVLAGALPRRGRGLHARRRAPDRRPALNPVVGSVASVFMSRWDVAVADKVARRPAGHARPRGRLPDVQGLPRAHGLATAGSAWRTRARACSGCCGPARARRTRRRRTRSTSTGSARRSRSTRCPRRRSGRSSTTAHAGKADARPTAATRRDARGAYARPGSTSTRSPRSSSRTAPTSFVEAWNDLMAHHRRSRARSPLRGDRPMTTMADTIAPSASARVGGARGAPRRDRATSTCATCSPTTRRAASASPPRARASTSTTRRTGSPTRRSRLLLAARRGVGARRAASRRCSAATGSTSPRTARCSTSRSACRAATSLVVDGVDVVAEVHEVLDRMAAFSRPRPLGRVEGPHGQAHPQRRQHRHRRLGPRARHGLRSATPLHAARPHVPLRLERRLDRFRRGDARPGGRRDALHRLVEDVHDARDDDERAHRARVDPGRARRRGGDRAALRGGLDERRRR